MRKKIIAGNWKMNKTVAESIELVEELQRLHADQTAVDVVVCPPYTSLKSVSDILSNTQIHVGSQNISAEDSGAYTGEVSHEMLKELYVRYVIIGHSERREHFQESDDLINRKVLKALEKKLKPILCVGESLEQRESGITEDVVEKQIRLGLRDINHDMYSDVVIAYEPVWAIGPGKTATAQQAQDVHYFIRSLIKEMVGLDASNVVRIQYGGSMKPSNAEELLSQADIDGGLIGGASLDAVSFGSLIESASRI